MDVALIMVLASVILLLFTDLRTLILVLLIESLLINTGIITFGVNPSKVVQLKEEVVQAIQRYSTKFNK